MPRVRTGYSFRAAAGQLTTVMDQLQACGYPAAPITDRSSTFGWVRWDKLCQERGLKPVFGVELAVTDSIHAKKPAVDYFTFIAIDDIEPINRLTNLATQQFRYEPLLTYEDVNAADGVFKIAGSRSQLDKVTVDERTFLALSPSVARGYLKRALKAGFPLVASSDNKFPRSGDQGFYEIVCGRNASTQTYDQHIQTEDEWRESISRLGLTEDQIAAAQANARWIMEQSNAKLKQATLVKPPRPKSLRQMCEEGADRLGVDLSDPDYAARLERELDLIAAKEFEDYFYLVAEICQWARERMIVGPARGSSAGSLVCYLTGITTVDPLKHGLIFERFIDLNRGGWFIKDEALP